MPEQLDPKKYFVMTSSLKKKVTIGILLFVLLVVPPLSFVYYNLAVHRPSQTDKEITFEINKGDSLSEIAQKLSDAGAINSVFTFLLYVRANGLNKSIQAGTYTIKAGTSIVDLVSLFQHGTNDIKITFKEGWRVEEFAEEAAKNLSNVDYKNFISLAKKSEGYLFPDTYYLNKDTTEEELRDSLVSTFTDKTKDILTDANLAKAGLTKDQAVIFASIVEREAANAEDRPVIAGILIKRWKENMKIDADATTQYAVALSRICPVNPVRDTLCTPTTEELKSVTWWPRELTFEDLAYDSPYNTRKNIGLPPGPISNPGYDALNATVHYQPSDYYFYLTDTSGVTHYARTLEEHNNNVQQFLGQ